MSPTAAEASQSWLDYRHQHHHHQQQQRASQPQAQTKSQPQHTMSSTCPIPIKDRKSINGLSMQDGSFLSINSLRSPSFATAELIETHSQSLGDLPLGLLSGHSPSKYWPGSTLSSHDHGYRPQHFSPESQIIGSDASNLAEDQGFFDNAYFPMFDYDAEQQSLLSPDQSQLVAGAGGTISFDPDETLLDQFSLTPPAHIQTSESFTDARLAAISDSGRASDFRKLSTQQVFDCTFGSFESPITSGSSFPSLDSTLPSSLTKSFSASERHSYQSQRPSARSLLDDSSVVGLTSDQRRSASSVSKQRQRSRAGSNNSTGLAGPRKAVRKGPLLAETRLRAGKMRHKKACDFCHAHKRGCALETPCPGCIQQHGNDILNHPCRDSLADCVTYVAMHNDVKWFPQERSLGGFHLQPTTQTEETYTIPVVTAFGPPMHLKVYVFNADKESAIRHRHVVQTPEHRRQQNLSFLCDDLVLPVALVNVQTLAAEIDKHVTNLVENHFRDFSWYRDQFNTLELIHRLYIHYRDSGSPRYAMLLQKSLRLLCLIHACDISISTEDPTICDIYIKHIWKKFRPENRVNAGLTACYLRAEFGRVIPELARNLLTEILQCLFQVYDEKGRDRLPVVVSVNVLVMMTLESIMSRGARIPYHFLLSKGVLPSPSVPPGSIAEPEAGLYRSSSSSSSASDKTTLDLAAYTPNFTSLQNGEACASVLMKRYRNFFAKQHDAFFSLDAQLPYHEDELEDAMGAVPAAFVVEMGVLVRRAGLYLKEKMATPCTAQPNDNAHDLSQVFDCLTARFFLDRSSS